MSDEEYMQEGINMQLKPIKDKIEVLEKHKHPEIIGKKEIYDLDFINDKQISEFKEWKEKQEVLDKAMRIEIHNNIPKLIKGVKKEIGMDILEEVLQDHLESHIRVARDQLTGKDRMTIFKKFDKDIENQLKKLDGEKSVGLGETPCKSSNGLANQTNLALYSDSKPSEPFRCLIHSWDNNNKCVNCDVMMDGKEPTEDIKKATNNIKYDFCQDCDWFLHEENEFYDQCDPDPIVKWCGYNKSKNKGYCGLKVILRKYLKEGEDANDR